MAEPHRYPSTDENTQVDPTHGPQQRRKTLMWVAIAGGLVALVLVLHLTGVIGAESH